eukprot:252070-Chlamydomonas_euryale.AAC.1
MHALHACTARPFHAPCTRCTPAPSLTPSQTNKSERERLKKAGNTVAAYAFHLKGPAGVRSRKQPGHYGVWTRAQAFQGYRDTFRCEQLCAALRCAALRCAVLCCAALRCAALRCAALRCAVLCCAALR